MKITKEIWSKSPQGEDILKYRLENSKGCYVELCSIGAAIVSIGVPDKNGKIGDVVLGYKEALSYFNDGPCSGKVPGRYANRIALGKFDLEGKTYSLPVNNGPNHLHGGPDGFQNHIWESRVEADGVEFMYFSPDGEAGYPGNLKAVVRYEWSEEDELTLTFTARTDAPTVINLTNHAYFNLDCEGNILDHILCLNASEYLPADKDLIPMGESEPVAGTPMDFVNPKALGRDIRSDFPALNFAKGYDSCFVIDGYQSGQIQSAAELYSLKSGRCLKVLTTQPGVHVYTGNWLSGCPQGKDGQIYEDYSGVALECQHFPDSPNKSDYPSVELRPDETYEEAIIFAFSVR